MAQMWRGWNRVGQAEVTWGLRWGLHHEGGSWPHAASHVLGDCSLPFHLTVLLRSQALPACGHAVSLFLNVF